MADNAADLKSKLEGLLASFKRDVAGLRSDRANPSLVEDIQVEVYGSKMRIRDLAHISAPDPRLIVVQPWDASQVETIAKGLSAANLGVTPAVEGGIIRLPLPPLTQERREEIVKILRTKLEAARVGGRLARMEAMGIIDSQKKNGEITEDEHTRLENQIQRNLDLYNKEMEETAQVKETELLSL